MFRSNFTKNYFTSLTISFGTFFLIMGFIFQSFYKSTREEIFRYGKISTEEAAKRVENYLNENINILNYTSETLSHMLDNGIDKSSVLMFIQDTSNGYSQSINSNFSGLYGCIYNVYYDGAGWVPPADWKMEDRPWYKTAISAHGRTVISRPYTDSDTKETVVSISRLFHGKNDILSLDFNVSPLVEYTSQIFEETLNSCNIFNSDGYLVAGPIKSDIGKNFLNDISEKDKHDFVVKLFSRDDAVFNVNIHTVKGIAFTAALPNGWHISYVINEKVQFRSFFRNLFICSILSLLLLGVTIYFCISSNHKTESALALSKQLTATSEIYMAMYEIDVKNNTFKELKTIPFISELYTSLDLHEAGRTLSRVMNYVVDDQFRPQVADFVDLSTLQDRMAGKRTITQEFVVKETGWCRGRFIVIDYDDSFNLERVLWLVEDIDAEKQKENQLRILSETDLMTGIRNRGSGERTVTEMISEGDLGMFILFDVDKFKSINDNYGHEIGDKVIIEVAHAMQNSFRDNDIIFRLGGDEFAAYALGVTDKKTASQVTKRLFDNISKIKIPELVKTERTIAISAGAAFLDGTEKISFKELYNRADEGVYKSKKRKVNSVTYYKKEVLPQE